MAVQHLFAFSSVVDGAAIAAGSPYGCGALPNEMLACYTGPVDIQGSIAYARWREARGEIDSLENLAKPILLFNGREDYTVYIDVMRAVSKQLQALAPSFQIEQRFRTNAAHVWSVDNGPCSCGSCIVPGADSPECCDVNNCGYELSADMLRHFFGELSEPAATDSSSLWWYDQHAYIPQGWNETWVSHGLWKWGFAYVPKSCLGMLSSCRIHVHYHGCIGKKWFRRHLWSRLLGVDNFAETNRLIVLYPQAAGDKQTGVGCWNWLSTKSDPHFDTQKSVQLRTVMAIVQDFEKVLGGAFQVPENSTAEWYSRAELLQRDVVTV